MLGRTNSLSDSAALRGAHDATESRGSCPIPGKHPVRDMPRCAWYGQHTYRLIEVLPDGSRLEVCRDCETHTRIWDARNP